LVHLVPLVHLIPSSTCFHTVPLNS
jgi:hypothetical protein